MSFKFDEKYIEMLKTHHDEIVKEGFPGYSTALNAFIEWMEGSVLCGCDYGCNSTSLENTAKLLALLKGAQLGYSDQTLEQMSLRDPLTFQTDLYAEMRSRAIRKRDNAPKN